ncbi:MAG: hypothetical protein QOI16_2391, partial [Pseudonocardiales bacterium]|nr:hypothetical protein [Pseudonocardiales bacterium]
MIWTDSVFDVMGVGLVVATAIWLGYAFVPALLRRRMIRKQP